MIDLDAGRDEGHNRTRFRLGQFARAVAGARLARFHRMKRQSRRPLALRKLTIATLTGARGGWHFVSIKAYCSGSCDTCREECGIEPDPTDMGCEEQTNNTCAQFVCF